MVRLLLIIFLILNGSASFAQESRQLVLKTDGNIATNKLELIINSLQYINKAWADKGESLSVNETEKYFTPDITLITNGRKVYTGYTQFNMHVLQLGENIMGNIQFPLIEVLSAGNKIVVRYNLNLSDKKGNYFLANDMAIFTINKNKIERWEEVVYSKYLCQEENLNVIYSNS